MRFKSWGDPKIGSMANMFKGWKGLIQIGSEKVRIIDETR